MSLLTPYVVMTEHESLISTAGATGGFPDEHEQSMCPVIRLTVRKTMDILYMLTMLPCLMGEVVESDGMKIIQFSTC